MSIEKARTLSVWLRISCGCVFPQHFFPLTHVFLTDRPTDRRPANTNVQPRSRTLHNSDRPVGFLEGGGSSIHEVLFNDTNNQLIALEGTHKRVRIWGELDALAE